MVLDSARDPKKVSFYQVKSKDPGDWSMSDICRKLGARAPRSIASRLYAHVPAFGDAIEETGLVSNAPYKFALNDGNMSTGVHHRIEGDQLHRDEADKLTTAVTDDISTADVPAWLPKLVFIRTTLGVHSQELVVIGRLQKHLEQFDQALGAKTSAIHETLHASITQKTSFSQIGADRQEAVLRKSLSKDELEELFLNAAGRRRSFVEDWEIIQADFQAAGMTSLQQIRLKTAALSYSRDRTTGRSRALQLSSFVAEWQIGHKDQLAKCATLLEVRDLIGAALPEEYGYSGNELDGALIVEAYEAINGDT
jgi:hypothetical protein